MNMHTFVGRQKPSKAIALKSGLQVMGSITEPHCAYKQKGEAFLDRKTNTLCYPSRQMISQECFSRLGTSLWICDISCLFSDPSRMAVHLSKFHKEDMSKVSEQSPLPDCSSPCKPMTQGDLIWQWFLPPSVSGYSSSWWDNTEEHGALPLRGTYIVSTLPASHMPNAWLNTAS